jgi:tRNA-dihydrouridine synthase B
LALVRIGDIDLGAKPLLLAPMEDVTDPSFRYMCKHFGADLMYSEFISADGLVRKGKKSIKKLNLYDYERPIGIQLYGHIPESMAEATILADQSGPDLIDINFGCPVKKIAARGAGAGMLNNLPLMKEITETVVKNTNIPVTAKTRLGWDEENKNVVEVAEMLQDVGIKAITIHGRTKSQLFKGTSDWTLIGKVKNNPRMRIPVFGNGDIKSPEDAKEAFGKYGVDGIMIGRAAIGRPWIFREIKEFLNTGSHMAPLTISEKVRLAELHLQKSLDFKGEPRGIYEMRRHFSLYFKALPDFRDIRIKLLTTLNINKIYSLLDLIAEKYGDY